MVALQSNFTRHRDGAAGDLPAGTIPEYRFTSNTLQNIMGKEDRLNMTVETSAEKYEISCTQMMTNGRLNQGILELEHRLKKDTTAT